VGFRSDPLTSATAVNTVNDTAQPGVRVYQTTNPGSGLPQGVVEWRTGFPGDVPARMQLTSLQQYRDAGFGPLLWEFETSLEIDGGTMSGGKPAPLLTLDVRELAEGGPYESVIDIERTDRVEGWASSQVMYAPGGTYRGNMLGAGTFGYDFVYPIFKPPTLTIALDGLVTLSGQLGRDSLANGTNLAVLPVKARPSGQREFIQPGGNNRLWRCDITPTGLVQFVTPVSPDWTYAPGVAPSSQNLSLDGISYYP
jgi:hypothetical protein